MAIMNKEKETVAYISGFQECTDLDGSAIFELFHVYYLMPDIFQD